MGSKPTVLCCTTHERWVSVGSQHSMLRLLPTCFKWEDGHVPYLTSGNQGISN